MSSQTNPKTVELYGHGIQREAEADGSITPGMLVEREGSDKVKAHGTEGGNAAPSFALPFGMTGRGLEDEYDDEDQVVFSTYTPGSGIYALLDGGEDVDAGDFLTSAGDGSLKEAAAGDVIVAQALDDVDNSGETDPVRIRVEVVPGQTVPSE